MHVLYLLYEINPITVKKEMNDITSSTPEKLSTRLFVSQSFS